MSHSPPAPLRPLPCTNYSKLEPSGEAEQAGAQCWPGMCQSLSKRWGCPHGGAVLCGESEPEQGKDSIHTGEGAREMRGDSTSK